MKQIILNKITSIFISICMALSFIALIPIRVSADDIPAQDANGLGWIYTSDTETLTLNPDYSGTVLAPSEIEMLSDDFTMYQVAIIDASNATNIKTVDTFQVTSGNNYLIKSVMLPNSVTQIADFAFSSISTLQSFSFGDNATLTDISLSCFSGCSSLKSIIIPASVETIGDTAFSNCDTLDAVTFEPNSKLKKIGDSAFNNCDLTKISIPSSVTELGSRVFSKYYGETSLTSIEFNNHKCNITFKNMTFYSVSPDLKVYLPQNADRYDWESKLNGKVPENTSFLRTLPADTSEGLPEITVDTTPIITYEHQDFYFNVTHVSGVQALTLYHNTERSESGAKFDYNCLPEEVTKPYYLETAGTYYFYFMLQNDSGSVISDYIPVTVLKASENPTPSGNGWSFDRQTGTLTFTDEYTGILSADRINMLDDKDSEDSSFQMSDVKHIDAELFGNSIDSSLIRLDIDSFANCKSLESIILPCSLLSVDFHAFLGCENLKKIVIFDKLTGISPDSVTGCKSLSEISVSPLNTHYKSVNGVLFDNNNNLIIYPQGKEEKTYSTPLNCTKISQEAFCEQKNLTRVNITGNLTSIDYQAFNLCTNLQVLAFPDLTTLKNCNLDLNLLINCPSFVAFIIPDDLEYSNDLTILNYPVIMQSQADISITTSSELQNGTQGTPYNQTIAVDNNYIPVSYSISHGTLPTGLSLNKTNGTISGTPATGGEYNFTITADNKLFTNSADFTLTIIGNQSTEPTPLQQTNPLTGKIKSANQPVQNATVKLVVGNTTVATTTTDENGNYSFTEIPDGIYNLVVTDGNKTKTIFVNMTGNTQKNVDIPAKSVSSVIEIKPGTPQVTVNGLDKIAERQNPQGSENIEVKFEVESKSQNAISPQDLALINEQVKEHNAVVDFFEMNINKITTDNATTTSESITDTNQAIEVVIPYNTQGKYAIKIYRSHNGTGTAFTQLSTRPTTNFVDGTYYVGDGYIAVYTKLFSTYALSYTTTPPILPTYNYDDFVPFCTPEQSVRSKDRIDVIDDNEDIENLEDIATGEGVCSESEILK